MGKSLFIFWVTFILFSNSHAQMMCKDLFSKSEPEQTISVLPLDMQLIKYFEMSRQEMLESRSTADLNEKILDYVVNANRLLENATDNVIMARLQNTPAEIRETLFQSTQVLLMVLERGLQVPYEALERALIFKIEEVLQTDLNLREEALLKQEIGFYNGERPRNISTETPTTKAPIGFRNKPADSNAETPEKSPIGFVHFKSEPQGPESPHQPIGFVPIKPSEDPVEKSPIGFVHFDNKGKEPAVYKITFDIEKGEFDIVRPGYKVGF